MKDIPSADRIILLRAAQGGNENAQQVILDTFAPYVSKLATITRYAQSGQYCKYIDEDIRVQIQATIFEKLPSFDLDGILQGRLPQKRKHKENVQGVKQVKITV